MHKFKNRGLLVTALTHSSYANENRSSKCVSNERLEFLGDSVLGLNAAAYLYGEYPNMPEGQMTKLRAELVCEKSLVGAAGKLGLGEYLRLGKGEEQTGGRTRPSVLADAVEALIAAVYLDGGADVAAALVKEYILDSEKREKAAFTDYKTLLQELVQRDCKETLSYELLSETGPDHDKVFTARVILGERSLGEGQGRSKKDAEQSAAKKALEVLGG